MSSCKGCGAPLEGDLCTYCGQAAHALPGLEGGNGGGGPCPRCEELASLGPCQLGATPLEACPRCAGIWVAATQLQGLLRRDEALASPVSSVEPSTARPEETVKYLRCPHCAEFMERKNYERVSGVIVDICHEHGIWLDAGELQSLREFMATGGRAIAQKAHQAKRELDGDVSRLLRESRRTERSLLGDLGRLVGGGGLF